MLPQRIAPDGPARLPGRIGRKPILYWMYGVLALVMFFAWMPGQARSNPVSPLAIDRATGFSGAMPWVSPTGEQMITYLRTRGGSLSTPGLKARTGGKRFTPFSALSPDRALTAPGVAFGSGGSALLVWQSGAVGGSTRQAIRPAGRTARPATTAGACNGPAVAAVSRTDRTLSACEADSGDVPGRSGLVGLGQMPSPIAPEEEVTPVVEELVGKPLVAWGTDGTGIVAFGYSEGDPAERTIAARIVGADGNLGEIEIVDSVADPTTLVPTGVAVLPNGTAAITANSDEGAVLFTRPPGAEGSEGTFNRIDLDQKTASMPAADQWGRLHFLTSKEGPSGGTAWSVVVLGLDGNVGQPIPVPTEGAGAKPVVNGFQVAPSGAEAIVTRSGSGFFRSRRKPGAGAFSVPKQIASSKGASIGAVVLTPQEDLILVWDRRVSDSRRQLMVGGWDGNGRPEIRRLSIPKRTKQGARVRLSVVASDPMGISRVVWKLPGNRRVKGASIRVRLRSPGSKRVEVAVYDRAGNRTLRIRPIKVTATAKRGVQGRAGTSGSPRP